MTYSIRSLLEVSEDIARVVERRGGLYDDSAITDPFNKHLFDNAFKLFTHISKLATQRYYDESGRMLKFAIINNAKIGAFATVGEKEVDFIGVHSGTISLLSAIFTRMLSNPNILSHIGNSSLETNAGRALFVPIQEDHENFSPCRPNCRIRSEFSKHLSLTGLAFIFGHEIGHITNGHFGIIKKPQHNDHANRSTALSSLENQAMELDADRSASEWTLLYSEIVSKNRSHLPVEGDDPLGISWRDFYTNDLDILRYCFLTSYITLRMTNPGDWNTDIQQKCYQPLPPYRMGVLMQVYNFVLTEFHELSFVEAQPYIYNWCIESEQAFVDFQADSGKGELQLSAIDSFFNNVGDYNDKVNEVYSELANELSEYSMEETRMIAYPRPRMCDYVILEGDKFTGILEANRSVGNENFLNLQCFIQRGGRIYGMPFSLSFKTEFDGDIITEALTSDGVNWVAGVEQLKLHETFTLSSIMHKTELLHFALQYSECPKLKADLIKLLGV